jgi:hypothetical protein
VGFTIYDLESAEQSRSRRELPRVIAGAVRPGGTYAEMFGLPAAAYAG